MSSPEFSYGGLLSGALLEVALALGEPVLFRGPKDALLAVQARTRLYRGVAAALSTHAVGPGRSARRVGQIRSVAERERTLLTQLQLDLAESAKGTLRVLDLDPARLRGEAGQFSARLERAVDAARLAWDVLSTHLGPDLLPLTPSLLHDAPSAAVGPPVSSGRQNGHPAGHVGGQACP